MTHPSALTVREPLVGARLYLMIAICVAVAMLEGFDITAISIAAPVMMKEFGLDRNETGAIFASGQVGLVLGAVLGGWSGDAFGRRNALLVGVLCFGVFCTATVLTDSFASIAVVRALTGVGIGLVMPNLISMAAECAPARHRGKIVATILAGLPAGGVIVAMLGSAYLTAWGWQSLFYIGGLLPLVLVLPILLLPNYRPDRAAEMPAGGVDTNWTGALFGEGRGVTTTLLWVALLLSAAIVYMMVSWLPSLMTERGFSMQISHYSSAMFSMGGCVGSFVFGFLIDRFGYRRVLPALYGGVLVGICGVVIGQASGIILASAGLLGFFATGAFYSLNGLSPLYYPSAFRGLGTGAAVGLGRVGSVLGPLVAGAVLQNGFGPIAAGPSAILSLVVPIAILAFVAVYALTGRAREPVLA